jgi:hypothetical protein
MKQHTIINVPGLSRSHPRDPTDLKKVGVPGPALAGLSYADEYRYASSSGTRQHPSLVCVYMCMCAVCILTSISILFLPEPTMYVLVP